jgi:pilus assembly protein TadC
MKVLWGNIFRILGALVILFSVIVDIIHNPRTGPVNFYFYIIAIAIGVLFFVIGTLLIKRKNNK